MGIASLPRRARVAWTLATVAAAGVVALSAAAVVRALHAPPAPSALTGEGMLLIAQPAVTIAGPEGITQVLRDDSGIDALGHGVYRVTPELRVQGFDIPRGPGLQTLAVSAVAVNGARVALALGSQTSPGPILLIGPLGVRRVPLPAAHVWLAGLHASGDAFAGYLAGAETDPPAPDDSATFALMLGKVRPVLRQVTLDESGMHAGAPVVVPGTEGGKITHVLWVKGEPVFLEARGIIGGEHRFLDALGAPVALPDDAVGATALRAVEGTFVDVQGGARPWKQGRHEGDRFVVCAGGDLQPIQVSESGDVVRTTGCDGASLRFRRDARGRPREVSVGEGAWKPAGSALGLVARPLADPIGDMWLLHADIHGLEPHEDVLLFDARGDRLRAPSPFETLERLADYPSAFFSAALIASWLSAIVSLLLLARALRLQRRFRAGPGSLQGRVAGIFTGVLEADGFLRTDEGRVEIAREFARVCPFTGARLADGDAVRLAAAVEVHVPTGAALFREAETVRLVPARDRGAIGLDRAAAPRTDRAFRLLLLALILELPVPLVLLSRIGLGLIQP